MFFHNILLTNVNLNINPFLFLPFKKVIVLYESLHLNYNMKCLNYFAQSCKRRVGGWGFRICSNLYFLSSTLSVYDEGRLKYSVLL